MQKARMSIGVLLALAMAMAMVVVAGCSGGGGGASTTTSQAPVAHKKVGVQSGTTGEAWATEHLKPLGAVIVPFKDTTGAFNALQAGNVDAVVNDLPVTAEIIKEGPTRGFKVIKEIPTGEQYGIGVAKDNLELKAAINSALKKITDDGELKQVYDKWIGSGGTWQPLTSTATSAAPDPAKFKLVTKGTILVGSDTTFPPFESMNGKTAEGFDVDMMNAIGKVLGEKVVFQTENFDTIIASLKGHKFDVIASGMTIKAEREKEIDFSDPYFASNQSIAVTEKSGITDVSQLK
jgi:polar amino acid transport system substrate-binding protein